MSFVSSELSDASTSSRLDSRKRGTDVFVHQLMLPLMST